MNPKISVIIPVLNNRNQLQATLEALSQQSYPSERIEIIVVDNGSDEDFSAFVEGYGALFLRETSCRSPYAARNKGIEVASGAVIALTDANKVPVKKWVEEGVKTLLSEDAELAGGDITFNLPKDYTAAEYFDSLYFNNNRQLVLNEGAAVTGNLFFKKELVNKVGLFPGNLRSGMDIWWTQKAVREGHRLVFAENAVVTCRPRSFKPLIKKSYRVGRSHPINMVSGGKSYLHVVITIIRTFAPPGFAWLGRDEIKRSGGWMKFKIWWVGWWYKIYMGLGRFRGLFLINQQRNMD